MNPWINGTEVVSLDAGGTLLEPWPSVGTVYARAAAAAGFGDLSASVLDRAFATAWRGRGEFDYSRPAWARVVTGTFGGLTPAAAEPGLFEAVYSAFACADAWRVFPEVPGVLQSLRQRGLRLVVVSNWDERLGPLLESLGFGGLFEFVLPSIEVGRPKPAPEIFGVAASRLGVSPAAILHVGDSLREDVAGAEAVGWRSVWLDRLGAAGCSGARVGSLSALLETAGE